MKRLIILIFTFACVALLFAGTAFAGTAPEAASYFTHSGYNKTYTGEDGVSHTMTVKWVGETWNKLGTVIYSINYEDVYQKDGNTYIDVMSATEIYENAKPSYRDSQQHSVYQVRWYADGSNEVVSDYRPAQTAQPEETPEPASSLIPEPSASTHPFENSSPPSVPPSAEAGDAAMAKPNESTTPTPESSSTPDSSATSVSPTPSENTLSATSAPTPDRTATQENVIGGNTVPLPSAPALGQIPESAPQDTDVSRFRWVWPVIVLPGIGACILLALYRRRKEEKDHGDHEA